MFYSGRIDSIYNDTLQVLSYPNGFVTTEKDSLISVLDNQTNFLMEFPEKGPFFIFMLSLLIAYAIASIILGKILLNTFFASIRYNTAVKIINDNSQLQKQIDFVLFGFYFTTFSLFLYILQNKTGWIPYDLTRIKLFFFNLILLITIMLSRHLFVKILGSIFEQQKLFSEYLNHGYFYNKLAGIVLLPLNFLIIFTAAYFHEIVYYFTIFLLLLILAMKLLRGIIFSLKHSILNFYLFLYLCALEIVPLLLLYKWYFFIASGG